MMRVLSHESTVGSATDCQSAGLCFESRSGKPGCVVTKKLSLRRLGLLRVRAACSGIVRRGKAVGLGGRPTLTVGLRWHRKASGSCVPSRWHLLDRRNQSLRLDRELELEASSVAYSRRATYSASNSVSTVRIMPCIKNSELEVCSNSWSRKSW
jgi:hypothetical protein